MSKLFELKPSLFDGETRDDIRHQIFITNATANMSDVERAQFMGLPEGCRIREGAKIISPQNLKIGRHVWIGENVILDASGGLEIGEHTTLGVGAHVWTHDSHKLNQAGANKPASSGMIKRRSTRIEERCYIGGTSVIMPGVTVRQGTVIGPMSVIYKDTEAESVCTPYRDMLSLVKRVEYLERELEKRNE